MEREFAVRFSHKGLTDVRTALKGMGADGAAGLKQIAAASTKVTPGLRAVDKAAGDLRSQFDQMAGRVPVIGGALQSLGPAGLAAAAGLAGIGMAVGALTQQARKAIEDIGKLKDAADTLQVSVEDLQALRGEGLLAGIDSGALDKMLQTLAINSAKASEGFGKMKVALDKVNPELGRQLSLTTTQAQRIDILAGAIGQATSANDKLNIATAAFGADGAQMIRVLDQSGASMESFAEKAKAAGLVLSENLVNEVEELGDRLDLLAAQSDIATKRMALGFAQQIEWFERAKTEAVLFAADLGEQTKGLQDQSEAYLADTAKRWRESAQQRIVSEKWAADEIARIEGELARRRAAAASGAPAASAVAPMENIKIPTMEGMWTKLREENEKKLAESARKAAEAQREQQAIEKASIALRQELGDWTGAYAVKQAELNALVGQYGVTQEMVNASLAKYRAQLDGAAEAQARWQAVIEAQKTPVERLRDAMRALQADERAGLISLEQYRAARAALNEEIDAAVAANAATADGLAKVKTASDGARDSSFELRFAAEALTGVFDEQINSLDDLGKVGMRVFKQLAVEALLAQSKIGGSQNGGQGFLEFVGSAIGGMFAAPVKHAGGVIGEAGGPTRLVSPAVFRNAPRHHRGLEPGERPIIAQDGERMFSRMDNARIVRAVESGGGGNVSIRIVDETGAKFETRETQGADGGREIEIRVRSAAMKGAASGDLDGVMRQRYGIQRQVK